MITRESIMNATTWKRGKITRFKTVKETVNASTRDGKQLSSQEQMIIKVTEKALVKADGITNQA